jgi:hypothetical protein
MRKLLILLFGTLVGLPGLSQTQLAEVVKVWKTKKVTVADGFTYRYNLWSGSDTAIYYQTGIDTFEVVTTFKKISGTKPPPVLPDIISSLDDNTVSPGQVYNPATNLGDNIFSPTTAWSHMKGQPWNQNADGTEIHYNKTLSIVDAAGAYLEITCICYRVDWYTEKRENHGIAQISLDGGTPKDVDLYAARTDNNSLLVWTTSETTPNATHKIRVIYTGRKNAAANATNIVHDYFKIYTKQ